jgi:hypothetical protein
MRAHQFIASDLNNIPIPTKNINIPMMAVQQRVPPLSSRYLLMRAAMLVPETKVSKPLLNPVRYIGTRANLPLRVGTYAVRYNCFRVSA